MLSPSQENCHCYMRDALLKAKSKAAHAHSVALLLAACCHQSEMLSLLLLVDNSKGTRPVKITAPTIPKSLLLGTGLTWIISKMGWLFVNKKQVCVCVCVCVRSKPGA